MRETFASVGRLAGACRNEEREAAATNRPRAANRASDLFSLAQAIHLPPNGRNRRKKKSTPKAAARIAPMQIKNSKLSRKGHVRSSGTTAVGKCPVGDRHGTLELMKVSGEGRSKVGSVSWIRAKVRRPLRPRHYKLTL